MDKKNVIARGGLIPEAIYPIQKWVRKPQREIASLSFAMTITNKEELAVCLT